MHCDYSITKAWALYVHAMQLVVILLFSMNKFQGCNTSEECWSGCRQCGEVCGLSKLPPHFSWIHPQFPQLWCCSSYRCCTMPLDFYLCFRLYKSSLCELLFANFLLLVMRYFMDYLVCLFFFWATQVSSVIFMKTFSTVCSLYETVKWQTILSAPPQLPHSPHVFSG